MPLIFKEIGLPHAATRFLLVDCFVDLEAGDLSGCVLGELGVANLQLGDTLVRGGGNGQGYVAKIKENPIAKAVKMAKAGSVISNVNYLSGADIVPLPREAWGCGMANIDIATGHFYDIIERLGY